MVKHAMVESTIAYRCPQGLTQRLLYSLQQLTTVYCRRVLPVSLLSGLHVLPYRVHAPWPRVLSRELQHLLWVWRLA